VFTLPYLNTVDITANAYSVNNTFNQNLSQYHSAVMPVYDSLNNFMHTFFFGGIGMYYRDTITNTLVVDSLVPFVNTISMVSRDSVGNMTEYELPIRFPALLGTNAEFIPAENIKKLQGNIIDVNALNDKTLVGYIFGGIESPEQNISTTDPSNSFATQRIYKVFINKNEPDTTITANYYPIIEPASLNIFPNPFDNSFQLKLKNLDAKQLSIKMFGANKQLIQQVYVGNEVAQSFEIDAMHLASGLYFIELRTDKYRKVYRVVKK
jgi:hypothetical protein